MTAGSEYDPSTLVHYLLRQFLRLLMVVQQMWARKADNPIMWTGHFRQRSQVDVEVTPPEITNDARLITHFRAVLCPLGSGDHG